MYQLQNEGNNLNKEVRRASLLATARYAALVTALVLCGGALQSTAASAATVATPGTIAAVMPQLPGATDIGFSQDMAAHHAQAILMTHIVLAGNGSIEVRALAMTMQTDQLVELGMMQGWLAVWGAPGVGATAPMSWMDSDLASDGAMASMDGMTTATAKLMPGMATQDELNQLATLSGNALDVFFLQLMIRHHDGGMGMSKFASTHAALLAVRALGARLVLDETLEVVLMHRLLKIDGGTPLVANF